jgi:hypothetical protein
MIGKAEKQAPHFGRITRRLHHSKHLSLRIDDELRIYIKFIELIIIVKRWFGSACL